MANSPNFEMDIKEQFMTKKIEVMLIEDNPEYREVIRFALEDQVDISLASQFGTAEIAIRTLNDPKLESFPDLILLDLRLPGMNGISALPKIRTAAPETQVIILSQSDNAEDVIRAISLGASGYLLKTASLDEIIEGILTVTRGGATIDKGVAKYLLDALKKKVAKTDCDEVLTQRELEILDLLAQGLAKKHIATQLGIGYATVDTHVTHIYEKLGVSNAPGAVHRAHQLGLLTPE